MRDIDFYSLCEHHMVPFFGRAHVAYIPERQGRGPLEAAAPVVEMYSRRLQVQERLTTQIAETLDEVLDPRGVGVVIESKHLCMMMRGVEKQNAYAITSSLLGEFEQDPKTRQEFMGFLRQSRESFV